MNKGAFCLCLCGFVYNAITDAPLMVMNQRTGKPTYIAPGSRSQTIIEGMMASGLSMNIWVNFYMCKNAITVERLMNQRVRKFTFISLSQEIIIFCFWFLYVCIYLKLEQRSF